jgi:hypothetical protein
MSCPLASIGTAVPTTCVIPTGAARSSCSSTAQRWRAAEWRDLHFPPLQCSSLFRGEAFALRTAGVPPALFSWSYDLPKRISFTSSLVSTGAPGPALNTGSPVIASIRTLAFRGRVLRGVSVIRLSSALMSNRSPDRSPSFRRIDAGKEMCPRDKTLILIINRQCLIFLTGAIKFIEIPFLDMLP